MSCFMCLIRTVMNSTICLYIMAGLGVPAFINTVIFEPSIFVYCSVGRYWSVGGTCLLWACFRIGARLLRFRASRKYLSKKKTQRLNVMNSISAKLCGLKTPLEKVDEVSSLSMAQLKQRVVVLRDLSSLDALEAIQVHLIRLMKPLSSCIAETIFDADVTAILSDQTLQRDDKLISALQGTFVCLSNCFRVKGEDCNASVVFKAGHCQTRNNTLVNNLLKVGAIPVALATTTPLLAQPDASSRLYGTVSHPTHPDRVVGSSSIAVVVQKKGACLGFGLDVLGDVRLAAANIGIVGFKPTAKRLSTEGIVSAVNFPEFLPPTVGIVGLHVVDIIDAMEALTSIQTDPMIPCIPFKPNVSKECLTIGVYENCSGIVPIVPSVKRVMNEVKIALKVQGHTIVQVELPEPEEMMFLALRAISYCDAYWNIHIRQHFGSSLTWNEIAKCCLPKIPPSMRGLLSQVIQWQQKAKCKTMKKLLQIWKKPIAPEAILEGLETRRQKFYDFWSDEEIDLLVGPVAPAPALLKKSSNSLAFLQAGYSAIFNLVNFPAGAVPFGKATQEDVKLAAEIKASPRSLEEQLLNQQKTTEGLPIAVQVVAKPWNDDLALRVMMELEAIQH